MSEMYRINGQLVDKNSYITIVFNKLLEYPFASVELLSQVLRTSPNQLNEFLLDGIVLYLKENPNVQIGDVCKKLKVNSSFIDELVDQGRVVVTPADISDLRNSLSKFEEEAKLLNKQKRRQELASQLQGAINSSSTKSEVNSSSSFRGYHYLKK